MARTPRKKPDAGGAGPVVLHGGPADGRTVQHDGVADNIVVTTPSTVGKVLGADGCADRGIDPKQSVAAGHGYRRDAAGAWRHQATEA